MLRAEELRDGLWAACDRKMEAAEAERAKLSSDSFVADQTALVSQYFVGMMQVELDRWAGPRGNFELYAQTSWKSGQCHQSHTPVCPLCI